MSTDVRQPSVVPAPRTRRPARGSAGRWVALAAVLVASIATAGFLVWGDEVGSLGFLSPERDRSLPSVVVDRGAIRSYLVESGALESANNTTIYCEVEAVLGTVGGPDGGSMMGGGRGGSSSGGRGTSGGSSSGGSTSAGGTSAGGVSAGGTGTGAGGRAGGAGTGRAGAAGEGGASGARSGGGSSGGGGSGGSGGSGGGGGSGVSAQADRPSIQSFSYRVTPHVPLRTESGGSGSSGGRGSSMSTTRGSGDSGGRDDDDEERAGSTRIIWLIDEGARVKPGQLVCELDASAFEDELKTQKIRHAQAMSMLLRAETTLQVAEIELLEYRDGIYPQDVTLVHQYLENCRTKEQEARLTYEWSQDLFRKGLRADSQLLGDRLVFEQWQIELENAREMERRLIDYTGPRILKSLEAKIEAVKADLLSQKAAFQVEDERLKRLERAVANCKLYAPAQGVVVYARNTSSWGRVEDEIAEGVTVRENQAIIQLPDPDNMQVQVKINESKISAVVEGMETTIRIDAFPDRPLRGHVKEIKPIPAPASMVSDVKLYSATVLIDGGFEGLRPGLSAEVAFHLGDRADVTRIPVASLRWVDDIPYAAIAARSGSFTWKRLDLGIRSPSFAEVLDGLEPGDKIVADPLSLPLPAEDTLPAERVAARLSARP